MSNFSGSLDTNVLLRLLLNDVPKQHKLAKTVLKQSQGQLMVADTAVIEIAFVMENAYQFTRSKIVEALDGLLSLPQLNANRALFDKALAIFLAHPALTMEDCCLAAYADLNDALPLWTFDRKLAKQTDQARLLTD